MVINDLILNNPRISLIVISFFVTLFITIVNYFMTDKEKMKALRARQKSLREEMKKHKNNPEKIIEERYVKVEKPTITESQNIVIEKNFIPAKKVTIDTNKPEERIIQFSSLENSTTVNYKSLEFPKNLGYYQGNYSKNNRGDINEAILRNYYMAGNTRFQYSYNRNNLNR